MLIRTLVGCYYNNITTVLNFCHGLVDHSTVCACGPTHILIRTHTHAHARSRMHTFSSVGLHFLIRTHTPTRSRTRGVMAHGPQCVRLLTNNTTHCKNLEKIAKTYGALRQGPRWVPMGPMGQPLKKTTTTETPVF